MQTKTKPFVIRKLTVKRSRWLRGKPGQGRLLDTASNTMCCLGFFTRACKLKRSDIADIGAPCDVADKLFPRLSQLFTEEFGIHGPAAKQAMKINDRFKLSPAIREKRLKAQFIRFNPPVKLTFID